MKSKRILIQLDIKYTDINIQSYGNQNTKLTVTFAFISGVKGLTEKVHWSLKKESQDKLQLGSKKL